MYGVVSEDYPRTLLDVEQRFSSEEACKQYLFALRWPEGFACPRCGGKAVWSMGRGLWLCGNCRYQASVTAGTIFQDSQYYLDEFTFRFNRRRSASRGKLFYRLVQQAVQVEPAPFASLIKPQSLGGG